METQRTTLSFLTESKSSAVGFSSMRRVAMTLLVMLLLTATGAWAQNGPVIPTPQISIQINNEAWGMVSAPEQAQMGTQVQFTVTPAAGCKIKRVSLSDPGIYSLAGSLETGHYSFTIGASNVTIMVEFEGQDVTKVINSLIYRITNVGKRQVELDGYEGDKPKGTLDIPANVIINGTSYSVTSIDNSAFSGCSSLESVTIPNSVTSIGYGAFSDCSSLASVTISNSMTSIGNCAFKNCGLTSVTIPNSVTSIWYEAFSGCSSLQSVTIPNSVTSIGDYAFRDCRSLESVTIPNSVTSIGSYAFSGCSNLQSVTIPNSVTSIGESAFRDCGNLQSIIIPNSVTSIGDQTFNGCDNLQSVTIPNSVTSIGDVAFGSCLSLQSITIPNSVTHIGYAAFGSCLSLQSITIPNSVTSIGRAAFRSCGSLTSVNIPNSVTSIGDNAFSGCSSLQSVTIPNSVTSIGAGAFSGCNGLTSITVEEGNTYYDSRDNCNAIIETKSNTLIHGCKNTIIPNSVTSIGNSAFQGCGSLESVTIPNSVTSIGDEAFADCYVLTSITLNSNPKIGGNAFYETPATVTMNLTASNVNGAKWTTFYNDGYNFQADENTTVYKGTVNESSLVLTEVEDKIVNSGTAVILKSTDNPVMTLTESHSSDTNGNDLRGFSDRFLRTDVIADFSVNAIYTMGNTSAGFGFHKYTGEYVPAQKAFLPLNTSNGAKAILTMVFADMTTGVSELQVSNDQLPVYDLNGRKVSENNLKPGVYVKNGKKFVVK